MKFNIGIPYAVRKQVRDSRLQDGSEHYWKHDRQITEQLVRSAIAAKYPQGSNDETIQELHASIDDEFVVAINKGEDEVTLERGTVKHILSCIEPWQAPTEWHGHVRRLRVAIKSALDAHDAAEKAKKEAPLAAPQNGAEKHAETAKV